MTPELDELLADINKARHQAGINAWWQDVFKRAYRAIGDLREMSAINESGCDRAMDMMEAATAVCKAQTVEIERLRAERLKLDKRIHNQRMALRETWEIVEMRRNYMGSPASRAAFASLLKRHQSLLAQTRRSPELSNGDRDHG